MVASCCWRISTLTSRLTKWDYLHNADCLDSFATCNDIWSTNWQNNLCLRLNNQTQGWESFGSRRVRSLVLINYEKFSPRYLDAWVSSFISLLVILFEKKAKANFPRSGFATAGWRPRKTNIWQGDDQHLFEGFRECENTDDQNFGNHIENVT